MYAYYLYLDGELITESNYEYETYSEAESEGHFAADTYSDTMDVHWSAFEVVVDEA